MENAIAYLLKQDAVFEKISQQFGFPIQPKRPQGFQTLLLLILEQQVSVDSAKATFNKLKTAIPDFIPENIILFSDEDFRACGVSRQKTKYIKALAEAVLSKELDLESLAFKEPEIVRQELIKIKGIGNWTIDIYWEYHAGVANIFKVLRVDFAYRGSYMDIPDAAKFRIKVSFGFYF